MNLASYVRVVPDFPKKGIMFRDISTLIKVPIVFEEVISRMSSGWSGKIDAIVALDARGFIFGAPMALKLGVPLVLVRKKGKLPGDTESIAYDLEYGTGNLEIHKDAFEIEGIVGIPRVLVVDDLLATGGTVKATSRLIKNLGAEVVGFEFVIELSCLSGRSVLDGYPVRAAITY